MIVIESPTKARLYNIEDRLKQVGMFLTYHDKRVDFEYTKAKKNVYLMQKLGENYHIYIENLKNSRFKSLLFKDDVGYWTHSGLAGVLADAFDLPVVNEVSYPTAKLIPWAKKPSKQLRPYQDEALEKLIAVNHGGVEIVTGGGKSLIILHLLKRYGLKAVVMTPSVSIANQLYDEAVEYFGKKHVGKFFEGKKEHKKLFTIAVAASLSKVQKDNDAYDSLSQAKVFISDESHLTAAKTLAEVALGLFAEAPYRFFFSGTQLRTDGLDLLLKGITGPIVYHLSLKEGVDRGYLAKPIFTMIQTTSSSSVSREDANEMTRTHLYYNPKVNQLVGILANNFVSVQNKQVLILVEELEQFAHLLPHLRHQAAFAHAGVTKENKSKLPEIYHKSNPKQLVEDFNAGKIPILVGTSCICTGTDTRTNQVTIYLQGGKSEIAVRQGAIGRSTRKPEGKVDCQVIDFDVTNINVTHRHSKERAAIYNNELGPVNYISDKVFGF